MLNNKIHVILTDDTNIETKPVNSLYIGEVINGDEYLALKDEFGNSMRLRDQMTQDYEGFAERFIEVSKSVNWNNDPKIVFQISDKTNKREVLEDLFLKFNSCAEMKPMQEILQVNNNRYEFVPFVSASGSYCTVSLNHADDRTVYEVARTLLTEIWANMDSVITTLWDAYKNFVKMIADLSLSAADQFSSIIHMDIKIIETKLRIDGLLDEIEDLTWVEKRWIKEVVDLRSLSSSRYYSLGLNTLSSNNATLAKWYIIQERQLDDKRNQIGQAMVEMVRGEVIDFTQSSFLKGAILITPTYPGPNSGFPQIALSGGMRYYVFRTPGGTGPLDKNLTEIDNNQVLKNKFANLEGYALVQAETFQMNDNIFITNKSENKVYKLSIKTVN